MKIMFTALLSIMSLTAMESGEITPHKYDDSGPKPYEIPKSSRFTTSRLQDDAPDIVYYLSKPKNDTYPIAILCGGSTSKNDISSIIHLHRYLLEEFQNLGSGVLTVDQWGVDGNTVNTDEFMKHYTRTQRLEDHRRVIETLKKNPPVGWNGKIILFGASEGGLLVTTLTIDFPEEVIATINWSGAGDWSWQEELWVFVEKLLLDNPDCPDHKLKLKDCLCMEDVATRKRYDAKMDEILKDPTASKEFLGMTYQYHADAQTFPDADYSKMKFPFLAVSGVLDSFIDSSDAFVEKARTAGANVTYHRINNMGHIVRKNPKAVEQTFTWLAEQLRARR